MVLLPHKRAAAAAIVGGLVWTFTTMVLALRPIGHPGADRPLFDLHPTILVAFVLVAWSATALASDLRRSGFAWAGAAVSWVGVALFTVNVAVVLATGDDLPVWPTHYSAFFCMAVGVALLGIAALRLRKLSPPVAIAMIVPPLLMPFGNAQDDRILLWLTLGIGFVALGVATLLIRRVRTTGPLVDVGRET